MPLDSSVSLERFSPFFFEVPLWVGSGTICVWIIPAWKNVMMHITVERLGLLFHSWEFHCSAQSLFSSVLQINNGIILRNRSWHFCLHPNSLFTIIFLFVAIQLMHLRVQKCV
jgi:hypothetical protein